MKIIDRRKEIAGLSLSLCLLILSFAFGYAEDYKSMIRYDRVWECISDGHDDPDVVVKCLKFAGNEEINGKEYHRIETFRKTFPKYDQSSKTFSYDTYQDGLTQHEGYLREEKGIAYTLIVCEKDNLPIYTGTADFTFGQLFVPGKYDAGDNGVIVEIPVYDFNNKLGETYRGMSFCMGESHYCDFTVNIDDRIEIAGEEYRKICLLPDGMQENEYWKGNEIVEGIGAIEYGCLNYHEFVDRPAMRWSQNYFNRLLDLKGNVIFAPHPLYEVVYDDFQSSDVINTMGSLLEVDAPIYDMMGNRISKPMPGQLYIQGGKKKIEKY